MFWWLFYGQIFKENIEEKPRIFRPKSSDDFRRNPTVKTKSTRVSPKNP